jgi:hypothetical protein
MELSLNDRHHNEAAAAVFSDTMFGKGWSRTLPPATVILLGEIAMGGIRRRELLDQRLRQDPHSPEGLDSSTWDPLHDWTDEELARLDDTFGESGEERPSAAEVRVEEAAEREAHLANMERYLASKNLPPEHTIGALLDLLIACDVVLVDTEGLLTLNPNAPLPAETLPLASEEASAQDDLRWRHIHEQTAQSIIGLFQPDKQTTDQLTTTLVDLGSRLGCDPEDARAGIQLLLEEGDFTSSVPPETAAPSQPLTLRVDWAAFNTTRISIRFGDPD